VQVVDPATRQVHLVLDQPPAGPSSYIGNHVYSLTGLRFAVTPRREIQLMDLRSWRTLGRFDTDHAIRELVAVPLIDRTMIAIGFDDRGDAVVELWDPITGRPTSGLFNRHEEQRASGINTQLRSLGTVPGAGGTLQIASLATDGIIQLSGPIGKAASSGGFSA
jgi:hypothetical protein